MTQENVFWKSEGDQWYFRNHTLLASEKRVTTDVPLKMMELYRLKPKKVLEIGCSNGWRLGEITARYGAHCMGIDPSVQALKEAKKKYPKVVFKRGLGSAIPLTETFDLVIVYCVLHWVSREMLFSTLKEIDRMVAEGGYLILGDFGPDHPSRTRYHHLPKKDMWTFKTDYAKPFIATAMYEEVGRLTYNHDTCVLEAASSRERGLTSLLKKSSRDYYTLTEHHANAKKRR